MPPWGWIDCNGAHLSPRDRGTYTSNQELYSLFGARFGGDGKFMFAIPNLFTAGKTISAASKSKLDPEKVYNGAFGIRYILCPKGKYPERGGEPNLSGDMTGRIRLTPLIWDSPGWIHCDGRELKVEEFPHLFEVIGTQYGGDGKTTFRIPDLRKAEPKIDPALGEGAVKEVNGDINPVRYIICLEGQDPRKPEVDSRWSGPFLSEMAIFAGDFAPRHWAFCEGQKMKVSEEQRLAALLTSTWGGSYEEDFFHLPFGEELDQTLREAAGTEKGPRYLIRVQGRFPKSQ
ncbi:MAG: tail fiber protein [Verrucomicrobiota bacterium]